VNRAVVADDAVYNHLRVKTVRVVRFIESGTNNKENSVSRL
jgi:hypothetical protein